VKAVIGLDIGSSAVKAVELKVSGKGFKVVAFGSEPVPPDSIVDGAIIDGTAVADAIRRLFENNKAFKTKDVAASLSGNAVIVKKINLPVMTEAELAGPITGRPSSIRLRLQSQPRLPDSRPGTGPDSRAPWTSLLVAAKKKDRRHRASSRRPAGAGRGRRRRVRAAERVRVTTSTRSRRRR
jgi:hypothetical protein